MMIRDFFISVPSISSGHERPCEFVLFALLFICLKCHFVSDNNSKQVVTAAQKNKNQYDT